MSVCAVAVYGIDALLERCPDRIGLLGKSKEGRASWALPSNGVGWNIK